MDVLYLALQGHMLSQYPYFRCAWDPQLLRPAPWRGCLAYWAFHGQIQTRCHVREVVSVALLSEHICFLPWPPSRLQRYPRPRG